MTFSLACPPGRGPAADLTLAACREAGCQHRECRAASAAHARLPLTADATGSARRLQALSYMGWSPVTLSGRLPAGPRTVARIQLGLDARIPAALAAAVSALYDQLWDMPGGSELPARTAAERGWCPPLAWDDDNEDSHGIDDPAAVPADWKPRRSTAADLIENISEIGDLGYSTGQQAAWRLGITRGYLHKLRSRQSLAAS